MSEEPELRSHPVSYDVDDLVELSKLVPRGPVQTIRLAVGALVVLLAFTVIFEVWSLTGMIDWSAVIVTIFIAVAVIVVTNRRVRARLWLRIMRYSPLHVPHSYAITPLALRMSSAKGVTDVRWTSFTDLRRSGDRVFAFMTQRQAFIIPRRAFDSDDQFEAFAAAAQDRWEQSHRL